jgi:uncharacterized protein YjbI with pentapeptide repeats
MAVRGLDWSDTVRHGLELDEVQLDGADLRGLEAPRLELRDCRLVDCDLANVVVRGASMLRVEVRDSRATGLRCADATLADVRFAATRGDLAAFRFTRLTRVVFDGCVLRELDLHGARLDAVTFLDCDLTGAVLTGATLSDVDLRRCTLDGVVGVEHLCGAAIERDAVHALGEAMAAALGIRLLD